MRSFLLCLFFIPLVSFSQYGVLDETFGDGGIVYNTNLPEDFVNPYFVSIEIDETDNIYVLGNYEVEFNPVQGAWDNGIFLARYFSDGVLDTSFGENGFQRFFIENYSILATDLTLTGNGDFLIPVSGLHKEFQDLYLTFVIKVDLNGDYIPGFADNGVYSYNGCEECFPQKIRELEDGNYLLAERSNGLWGPEGITLTKLSATGQPVVSFGINGRKNIWQPNPENFIKYVDFTSDENNGIYVLSLIQDGTHNLYKFDESGNGESTMLLTDFLMKAHSLVYNEGGLYISGDYNGQKFFIEHYFSENLNLDAGFGNEGIKFTDFNFNSEVPTRLLVANKLYQTGYAGDVANGYKFALAAHTLSGTADNSFGQEGKVTTSVSDSLYDVGIDSEFMGEDKIVVLNYSNLSMARYAIFNILEVEDIFENSQIDIAPNPVSNSFIINGLIGNDNQIQIFDLSGKSIREFDSIQDNQKIELGSIPKGTYVIKITSGGKIESKKLIVK